MRWEERGEDEGKEQKKDDGDENKLRKVKLGGGQKGRRGSRWRGGWTGGPGAEGGGTGEAC